MPQIFNKLAYSQTYWQFTSSSKWNVCSNTTN